MFLMQPKIFITFSLETNMDPDNKFEHFDPSEITKALQVQPIQTQAYDLERKEPPRSRRPGNPWCSSWIYRLGGYYDEEQYTHPDGYIQHLLEQFNEQFLTVKQSLIIDIQNRYNAICYLEIYLFSAQDSLTHVSIPSNIMKSLLTINCSIDIYTHSQSIEHYPRYEQKDMYKFK